MLDGLDDIGFQDHLVMIGAKLLATMRAYSASLKSCLVKPIEKVFTGPELARAISATTIEESVPPLRNAPERHVGDQTDASRFQQAMLQFFQTLFFALGGVRVVWR